MDINELTKPVNRDPEKGDIYYRRDDDMMIYICGTCISMNEGEEGEKQVVYVPLNGPYNPIYTLSCKEFISGSHTFVTSGIDLRKNINNNLDGIDSLLNPDK